MKKFIINHLVAAISLSTILVSCQKSDIAAPTAAAKSTLAAKGGSSSTNPTTLTPGSTTPVDNTPTTLTTLQLVTSGQWKVANYVEGTENSTSKFSNYIFTFTADNKVQADEKGKITYGSWYERVAVFYYGIPSYGYGPEGFTMSIGSSRPLILLSKNLFFTSKTSTTIHLDSINPAEDSHLTLVKI